MISRLEHNPTAKSSISLTVLLLVLIVSHQAIALNLNPSEIPLVGIVHKNNSNSYAFINVDNIDRRYYANDLIYGKLRIININTRSIIVQDGEDYISIDINGSKTSDKLTGNLKTNHSTLATINTINQTYIYETTVDNSDNSHDQIRRAINPDETHEVVVK